MVNVPLPVGYVGIDDLPKQRELLINCINLDGSIVRTPGIDSLLTHSGTGCRGSTTWAVDGKAYFVIGTDLVRVEANETLTTLGTIAGAADCDLVGGQVQLVVLVRGGNAYTYSPGGGLAQITDPNFVPCVSVDYIDGRHVYIPADGSPAIYSEVDDAGTFTALSFFDAEESPDVNRFIINVQNQLFIMGEESTEMFISTGDADAPFSRSGGQRIDYGYAAGGVRFANTYCFIGRQRSQSYAIYVKETGGAQEISNAVVNEDLNGYTKEQIEAVRVNRFKWYGKELLAWSFHDKTYVFCEGNWIFMDSDLNGTEAGPWRVNGVAFANGKYYVGDRETGNIGVLSESPSEYGEQIEYQFDTYVRAQRGQYMTPSSLEADVLAGQNATTIGLSLSRDGRIRGDYHYRGLGSTGHYQRRIRWNPSGGLGRYESYMGISIRGTGKVQFSAEGLYVN